MGLSDRICPYSNADTPYSTWELGFIDRNSIGIDYIYFYYHLILSLMEDFVFARHLTSASDLLRYRLDTLDRQLGETRDI